MSTTAKYVEVYAKQVDVAREFGVTEATVHNWIKSAEAGNNNLKIKRVGKKRFIIDSQHNKAEMHRLKDRGRKHASNLNEMIVHADEEKLLSMFGESTLKFLINYLQLNGRIPIKYDYFNGGATVWDRYYKLINSGRADEDSFEKVYNTIFSFIESFDKINVIDIGCGNGLPVCSFVKRIQASGKLNKFCITDISKDMISIAEKNLKDTFKKELISHVIDFEIHSFQELLFNLKSTSPSQNTTNLILFSGSTIGNYPSLLDQVRILSNIRDGMSNQDFLYISNTFDREELRTVFPLERVDSEDALVLTVVHALGLDDYTFKRDFEYNPNTSARELNLSLKYVTKVIFNKLGIELYFNPGDKINVWSHRRDTHEFISEKLLRSKLELQFLYLNTEKNIKVPKICYLATVA